MIRRARNNRLNTVFVLASLTIGAANSYLLCYQFETVKNLGNLSQIWTAIVSGSIISISIFFLLKIFTHIIRLAMFKILILLEEFSGKIEPTEVFYIAKSQEAESIKGEEFSGKIEPAELLYGVKPQEVESIKEGVFEKVYKSVHYCDICMRYLEKNPNFVKKINSRDNFYCAYINGKEYLFSKNVTPMSYDKKRRYYDAQTLKEYFVQKGDVVKYSLNSDLFVIHNYKEKYHRKYIKKCIFVESHSGRTQYSYCDYNSFTEEIIPFSMNFKISTIFDNKNLTLSAESSII